MTDPRFIIAYTIIAGFFVAYAFNPSETMNGALIAGFAGAWGYFLGSSNSSNAVREQVGKALDIAANSQAGVTVGPNENVSVQSAEGSK